MEAFLENMDKAFSEVKEASNLNKKPLITAHNIFPDLENIWWEIEAPPHGVTATEEVLKEGTK